MRTYVVIEREYRDHDELVSSRVRYKALKADDRWTSFVASLADINPVWVRAASQNDRMAFWINTYNTLAIDTVVRHYPIRPSAAFPKPSIRAIADAWQKPYVVAGKKLCLEDIENTLARLGDGRVWFLVCPAASGGPNLRPYALTPSNIEQELESACGGFCNDPRKVMLDRSTNQFRVVDYLQPRLTDFYDPVRTLVKEVESYPPSVRGLVDTIFRRLPSEGKGFISQKRPSLVFVEMDWSLNEAP